MTRWSRARDSRRTLTGSRCLGGTEAARSFRCSRSEKSPTRSSTGWSRLLGDEWERYLRQQVELGGAEVVLSRGVGRRVGESEARRVGESERRSEATERASASTTIE